MGIFSRKQPQFDKDAAYDKISDLIKEYHAKTDDSVIFLTGNDKGGSSLVSGHPAHLHMSLVNAGKENGHFAEVLKNAGQHANGELPEIFKGLMNNGDSKVVDLPNGEQAIALHHNDIDSISDEQIDNIVDQMVKAMKNRNGRKE